MQIVYMDHAASTPVRREVLEEMLPFFQERFGNPSAIYDIGIDIKGVIEDQREKVANLIGAEAKEIVFTSSGAEANNLAVKGAVLANRKKGNHIIVSTIEHHSVLNAARFFERMMDYEVTFLPVNNYGLVDPQRLAELVREETVLVSIMHGNNEIGTIEPISGLAAICRDKGVLFHTDAVATVGNIPVNVKDLNVDMLSLTGPPLGAPKGIGALYFRSNTRLMPLIHGGIQEMGRRGGTENVPGIVGLGKAAELTLNELPEKTKHVKNLKDRLVSGIMDRIEEITYTGHPENRLPGHASFCIAAIEGEALLLMLNQAGIYANTGSACASKALKISPVLVAIGVPAEIAQGSIVFTLDRDNTAPEVDYILEKLPAVVERLRSFSPLWKKNI